MTKARMNNMTKAQTLSWYFVISTAFVLNEGAFQFASYYSDHMVLQKGKQGAIVWGTSTKLDDTVHVFLNGQEVAHGVVTHDPYGGLMWMVKVTVNTHNYGPYNLTARSSLGTITLHDVMFGDVWVCSGQSNMEFTMTGIPNASEEYVDALQYSTVRVFQSSHAQTDFPLKDFSVPGQPWSVPSRVSLSGFSAVCWLYGKQLSSQLQYPIGLMESNWGGTRIEWWSSSDSLNKCANTEKRDYAHLTNSQLWNAMMNPLTRNTIYGVIWYQGEANLGQGNKYTCQFPAMISDWRHKFSVSSNETTSALFPFGFVQLAPNAEGAESKGFPDMRWAQTSGYGRVPNAKMANTFMAVAMDLPDFTSPYGSIHPRFKHDVASRLALSGLAIAYHRTGIEYQGPYPSIFFQSNTSIVIEYDQARKPIRINTNVTNFEVCCSARKCDMNFDDWKPAPIKSHNVSSVRVNTNQCGSEPVSAIRYAWQESPCQFKQCAVYGRDTDLPAPPFYHSFK